MPGRKDLDQPTVETLLKEEVQNSPGWQNAHEAGFAGLPSGFPMVAGIIVKLAEQFTGLDISSWLDAWNDLPVIGTLDDIVLDAFGTIFSVSANLQSLFGDLNFLDPDFDPGAAIESFIELVLLPTNLLAGLVGGLLDVSWIPGLDASKIVSGMFGMEMIDGLLEALSNVPILGDILGWFGLDPDGDESDLQGFLGTLLTGDSPLNAFNLFGELPSRLLGMIPFSHIGAANVNLLDAPNFSDPANVSATNWVQVASGGRTSPGFVRGTANGTEQRLVSNRISVAEGDEIEISVFNRWSGLVYTGTPFRLVVVRQLGSTTVGTDNLAAPSAPGATNSTWTFLDGGTYVVPAGCDGIRVQLTITANCTAGTVDWDDADAHKTSLMKIDWIYGLGGMLEGFTEGIPIISDIVAAIIPGGAGGDLADLDNIFTDLFGLLGDPDDVGTGTPSVSPLARIPIFGGLLDGLFGGFTGIFDQPADQALVAEAAEGVSASLTGQAAALSMLEAALSPGNPDADDFEFSASGNWGGNWLVMEDGNGGDAFVDGHNAGWNGDYGIDTEVVCRRLTKQAAGQNQTVSVVLASSFTAVTDGNPAVDLWVRMTNFTTHATRTGMRCRFWGNRDIEVAWFNNGTKVWSQNGTSPQSFASSTTLTFQAGEGLLPRRFIVKVNGSPLVFDEAGTASSLTGTWRGAGGRAEFSLLFFPPLEMQPGKFKSWTATG